MTDYTEPSAQEFYQAKRVINILTGITISISLFCFMTHMFYDLMYIVAVAILFALLYNWSYYAKYGRNI